MNQPKHYYYALSNIVLALNEKLDTLEPGKDPWRGKSLLQVAKQYGASGIRSGCPKKAFSEVLRVLEPFLRNDFPEMRIK